jgi:hypothetical protein
MKIMLYSVLLAGVFLIGLHTSPCPSLHSMVGVTICLVTQMPQGLKKTMKYQPGYMTDIHIDCYAVVTNGSFI